MTLADIFNCGSELKAADGTVYVLTKPTLIQQGQFQRWLEQRAHDAIDRDTRPSVTEAQRDRRHALVDHNAGLGKYEWDGPFAMEAMFTPAGMAKFLSIVCAKQGVTEEKAEEILRHHAKEVAVKILTRAASDPKRRADLEAALGALGLPMDWLASVPSEPSSSSSSTPPSPEPSGSSAG